MPKNYSKGLTLKKKQITKILENTIQKVRNADSTVDDPFLVIFKIIFKGRGSLLGRKAHSEVGAYYYLQKLN